ncbi:MAG: hypothetical protein IJV67_02605 [Clostridia bacterium]|nr:hypothetical protein [Clostridia bacterium]
MRKKDKGISLKKYEAHKCDHSPERIFTEYREGINYKQNNEIFDTVRKNENFFIGKQWEGVNAPNMDKPVFNILKRVTNFFIANLVSDDIGIRLKQFGVPEEEKQKIYMAGIRSEIEQIHERSSFNKKMRSVVRDAAVTGDGAMHYYFDPQIKTGRPDEEGMVTCEVISSTDVIFGNPMSADVQSQPYIIIAVRRTRDSVIEELIAKGMTEHIDKVVADEADNPNTQADDDNYSNKVTVLLKYFKQQGKVYFTKVIKNFVIQTVAETGMSLYPLAYMNWEARRNSMHGVGVVDGLIPNQIAINKLGAMANHFIKQQAFPRIIYNESLLPGGWKGGMAPIACKGDPQAVVGRANVASDMSEFVPLFFEKFIETTKELMGASDASLGNVKPENTSAIIAVQKSTTVPLELVKQEYHQFIEDGVRIIIDMMGAYYGKRQMIVTDDNGDETLQSYDFGKLTDTVLTLNVDIGATAYWQEMTDVGTLDNLKTAGVIDDLTYVESLPAHVIPNRAKIVEKVKERVEAAEQAAQMPAPDEGGAINMTEAARPMI